MSENKKDNLNKANDNFLNNNSILFQDKNHNTKEILDFDYSLLGEKKQNFINFQNRCNEVLKKIMEFENPLIVNHFDADGLTSGSIVIYSLKKLNKKFRVKTIKKLTNEFIDQLIEQDEKEIIFVDLGGGQSFVNKLDSKVVIIDHHQTKDIKHLQANPQLFNFSGSTDACSATVAYLIFKNRIDLAITGAIGDMQYPFMSINKMILEYAKKNNLINIYDDLLFYGKFSRNLINFLSFADEPYIPGISGNEKLAKDFLISIGFNEIDLEKKYCELEKLEKIKLIKNLLIYLSKKGQIDKKIVGENYIFEKNEDFLKDASEFSTVLNACGRNDMPEVGIGVCLFDKEKIEKSKELLIEHKKNLREAMFIATKKIVELDYFYFLDARNLIRENIIGVILGMMPKLNKRKPMIAYALDEETNGIKISTRFSKGDEKIDINLGEMMKYASQKCQGIGGGHKIAAGSLIKSQFSRDFLLSCMEYIVKIRRGENL